MTFDLEDCKRRTARLEWDDLDTARFRDAPLSADVLRCIRYMHDVEYHTTCYLRELLVTPAHADPAVTGFLTLWAYEEFWHGRGSGLRARGPWRGLCRGPGPVRPRQARLA